MALPATEDFTGGAGALSGSWTQQRTTPTVNKNGAGAGIGSTAGQLHFAFWNADVFSGSQYAQETIVTSSNGAGFVTVRAAQAGDAAYDIYYLAAFSSGTEVGKIIDGATTVLATPATTWANGDVLRLEVSGTTLTAKKNGASISTPSDVALSSGSAGCGMNGSSFSFDDWEGGDLLFPSAVLTGTAMASITEADIVAGGKTIIVTLTDATWIPA